MAEQKQEMVARGEGAQQLEPNLVELPCRCAARGTWLGAVGAGGAGSLRLRQPCSWMFIIRAEP